MHGQIGLALQQRLLQLLDEQPLAADLGQGHVEDAIALGLDGHQHNGLPGIQRPQARGHMLGLPERQGAAAGGDAQGAVGHARDPDSGKGFPS